MQLLNSPSLRQYVVVCTLNLATIIFGLNIVWASPALVKLQDPEQTILPEPITDDQGAWLVSLGYLLSIFVIPMAVIVDRFGRKNSLLMFSCIPKIALGFLFIFSSRYWMLLLARTLTVMLDCIVMLIVPVYAGEIASDKLRGSLGTMLQIFSSLGILVMHGLGPILTFQQMNIMLTSLTIATTIPIFFLPPSPYFLYAKGRTEESVKVLTFLRGSETLARQEMQQYGSSKADEVKVDKRDLLKDKTFLKSIGIVFVLAVGISFIGFTAVNMYLQTILQSTGTSISDKVSSIIIGFIQLFASFCTAFTSDRFGRKPIFVFTLIAMTVGMVGLGTFFWVTEGGGEVSGFMNVVPLISLVLLVFGYGAGPGCLSWVLVPELFAGPGRGVGSTVNIVVNCSSLFLTTRFFPNLLSTIGPAITYWIFAGNCILLCLFIVICIPETKGKSVMEIQKALGAKVYSEDVESKVSQIVNTTNTSAPR